VDPVSREFLQNLRDRKDDTILSQFTKELANRGIEVISQKLLLQSLLLPPGVYSKKQPDEKTQEDIDFGMDHAKKIGEWDIGQTVVVKDKSVLAVEAIEGTDECILRGGKLARKKGAVVCKAEKKHQDDRFDIPTVGLDTLKVMKRSGANVLAIEANKTFVVTPEEFVAQVNRLGFIFVAV
ncbi:MAG: LpxI family protein, partial [Candidatus Hydrogenedentota bacterium]